MTKIIDYGYMRATNLTDTPAQDIENKLLDAMEWVNENEDYKLITHDIQNEIIERFNDILEDFDENGKVQDIMSFIDNIIVNFDYVEFVKEVLTSIKE